MLEIAFTAKQPSTTIGYTIVQQKGEEIYFFYNANVLVGSIQYVNGIWVQDSGREIKAGLLKKLVLSIEKLKNNKVNR